MDTHRYFIELSYDGTAYHGWQIQPNALAVQQLLDQALSTYFRQPVASLGCGRTDTGVHAKQFFAHFDLLQAAGNPLTTVKAQHAVTGLNSLLPYDISIKRIIKVGETAHARFDALERGYQYLIHFHKDPFKLNRSWLFKGNLDIIAMNHAAEVLLHHTDFSCFSKSHTQTFTNNCKVTVARFTEHEEGLIFNIKADRFLRNMVRAIVGTLIRVGKGEIGTAEVEQIIESKNRSSAGQSVPACGLYLTHVKYPYID